MSRFLVSQASAGWIVLAGGSLISGMTTLTHPQHLRGILPAIVSPRNEADCFDVEAFERVAAALYEEEIHGLYVAGVTGEGYYMTSAERKAATETAVRVGAGRGKVIVHAGTQDARSACELTQHAVEAGADAVASIPPFGRPYGEIFRYYQELARAASGRPVLIYYIPVFTRWHASYSELARLADIPGVQGIKYTDYDLLMMAKLCAIRPDFVLLYGRDEQLAAGLAMGALGGVGSTYNVFPRAYCEIESLVRAGRLAEAFEIQQLIVRCFFVMEEFGLLAAIEALLASAGLCGGTRRLPAESLDKVKTRELIGRLAPVYLAFPERARTGFLGTVFSDV